MLPSIFRSCLARARRSRRLRSESLSTRRRNARSGRVTGRRGASLDFPILPRSRAPEPARAVDAARDLLSLVSGREFDGHQLRLRIGVATSSGYGSV